MKNLLLEPIIEIWKKEGMSDEKIAETLAEITAFAEDMLYKHALDLFTDEDFKQIEECKTTFEETELIESLYTKRMGKTPEELMRIFLEEFVKDFLADHKIT